MAYYWRQLNPMAQKDYLRDMTPIAKISSSEDLEKFYADREDENFAKLRQELLPIMKDGMTGEDIKTVYQLFKKYDILVKEFRWLDNEDEDDIDALAVSKKMEAVLKNEGVVLDYEGGTYYFSDIDAYFELDDLDLDDYNEYSSDKLFGIFEESIDEFEEYLHDGYMEYIEERVQDEIEEKKNDFEPDEYQVVEYVANILGSVTNYPVATSDEYHAIEKDENSYTVEPDSSIDGVGAEIVSPVFTDYDEFLSELDEVLRHRDLDANDSTGLHINIGTFDTDKIDLLKLAVFLGEDKVLHDFGRSSNTYTKPMLQYMDGVKSPSMVKNLQNEIKYINKQVLEYGGKYQTFNVEKLKQHGYLEFRAIGGPQYMNFERVKKYIGRYLRAINIAMDPNAYRQEYLKKLYKFLDMGYIEKTPGKTITTSQVQLRDYLKSWHNIGKTELPTSYEMFKMALTRKIERYASGMKSFSSPGEYKSTLTVIRNRKSEIIKMLKRAKKELPSSDHDSFKEMEKFMA